MISYGFFCGYGIFMNVANYKFPPFSFNFVSLKLEGAYFYGVTSLSFESNGNRPFHFMLDLTGLISNYSTIYYISSK